MAISTLIDKRDWLEVVRDAIAAALLSEVSNQQSIATADGIDPVPWGLRVFSERTHPWGQFLDCPDYGTAAAAPVVNVRVDTDESEDSRSDPICRHARRITYHVDCYGYGLSEDNASGGHHAGDRRAALEAQRAARLVRNVLMSGHQTYLGLRGVVMFRMVRGLQMFVPAEALPGMQSVVGCRITVDVDVDEDSPQVEPIAIEAIGASVTRSADGFEYVLANHPVTPYSPPDSSPWQEPQPNASAIGSLIDKQDNVEEVRAQIASVLATEIANQQSLASNEGLDPSDWNVRVFEERTNPWSEFLDCPDQSDAAPIVNVTLDSTSVLLSSSDPIERQAYDVRFHIDCVGYGLSEDNASGGHHAGDRRAALEAQRAARLVRNVLMSGHQTYLGLRGVVWRRYVESTDAHRPEPGAIQSIAGVRITFVVRLCEFSPQYAPDTLDTIRVSVERASNGEVLAAPIYGVVPQSSESVSVTLNGSPLTLGGNAALLSGSSSQEVDADLEGSALELEGASVVFVV